MKKPKAYIHGECIITQVKSIPTDAKQEKVDGNYCIIAPSEVTGNHHVIDCQEGVEFFLTRDNRRFIQNSVEASVRCLIADRHTTVNLPPGTYEIGRQNEYDYITQALQKVRD